jgi:hypothetical protein
MKTIKFKAVPSTRLNGIMTLSKMTGYSRYHIQKCVKGERKMSPKLQAVLKRHGVAV